MSRVKQIQNILIGLGMLLCGVIFLLEREAGYILAAVLIVFSLAVSGVRMLFYYHTMARHMVGGKALLFLGILILNFAVFTLTVVDTPMLFIVIYLLVFHSFSGVVSILRAREARSFSAASWVFNLAAGLVNLAVALLAVLCAVLLHSIDALVFLYCAGLFYSALMRITSVFHRTAIVYIP